MFAPEAELDPNLIAAPDKLVRQPTRDGFGDGLLSAAKSDPNVVGLCADVTESTRMNLLKEAFPDRFVQLGVHEQLLVALGAGLALAGKVPFVAAYAVFSPGRAWEQVRTNVCLNDANVKIVGSHAGVTVGPDGATHQALEDIAIMRVLPNMKVVVPCDAVEARKATLALARTAGPAYLRLGREKTPTITTDQTPFEIGRAVVMRRGRDAAIIACGVMVAAALAAAEELAKEKIDCSVLDCHTIKPIDQESIFAAAEETRGIVTAEDHSIIGGLGSAVCEVLAEVRPTLVRRVGLKDCFASSGRDYRKLLAAFHLDASTIQAQAEGLWRAARSSVL